jgi:uncharacterized protein
MNEEFQNQDNQIKEPGEEQKPLFSMHPVGAAFIALIGIFLLYQAGGAILTLLIFGFNFEKADVNAIRMLTMGGQILLMLAPALILARLVYGNNISEILRVRIPSYKEVGAFVIGLIILTPLLQNFLYIQNYVLMKLSASSAFLKHIVDILDKADNLVESTYDNILTSHSIFESSFIIFVVAVIPALCEETLFRGLVQKSFELKMKPLWAILITSVFFGFYHFSPYGLIGLISLGAYFGYAAYVSDSIFVTMTLHFLNNLVAVLAFFILGNDELIKSTPVKYDSIIPQLISFAMFAVLFFSYMIYVKTNYHKLLPKSQEEL